MECLDEIGFVQAREMKEAFDIVPRNAFDAAKNGGLPVASGSLGRGSLAIKLALGEGEWNATGASDGGHKGAGGAGGVLLPGLGASTLVHADGELVEKVAERHDLMNIGWLSRGIELSRAVARVHVGGCCGTGFLVGPGLLLTNHHVIPNATTAESRTTLVEFGGGQDRYGARLASKVFRVSAEGFRTNAALDYSLVRVEGSPESEFGVIDIADYALPVLHERLQIVQHASGAAARISLRNNMLAGVAGNFIQYTTDTEPGTSGSPCFNRNWQLVALHQKGGERKLAGGGTEFINQGVLISSIVNDAFDLPGAAGNSLEELVFDPLVPILTRVIRSDASPVSFLWVLNGFPRFSNVLARAIVRQFGAEGMTDDRLETAPVVAAALGIAAGAGIQILARKLGVRPTTDYVDVVPGELKELIVDVMATTPDARQAYREIIGRIDFVRRFMSRVIAESELADDPAESKAFPVAVAAYLAGVGAGAAAARA